METTRTSLAAAARNTTGDHYPRAVLFDLLTALLDSWTLWNTAAGSEQQGRAWRAEYLRRTYGCGAYQPYEDLVREAAAAVGLSAAAPQALEDQWDALPVWSGAQELLTALKPHCRLAVVTNCSRGLGTRAAARLGDVWDVVVTSEEAGFYKPNPRPYQFALQHLGVSPQDAAFVAGSGYDLFGTSAVGLRTYWHNRVRLSRPDGAPMAEVESSTLDGALPWLQGFGRAAAWPHAYRFRKGSSMMSLSRMLAGLAALCTIGLPAPAAYAQGAFPSRPVTLVVPFPAGGPSDALARAIAQKMGEHLGQPLVVENVGGANGTIGLTKALKASPDGYTIAFGGIGTHVANVALYKKLAYDPVADFSPIGPAGAAPLLLLARADLPAGNLREFVAWAAKNKEKASYGSAGVGSISHYGCVLLLSSIGQNLTHVPYKGVAPAMNDLMGGQTDFLCDQTTTALPQVAGGRIKAIAVLSAHRLPQLPQTATAAEAGYALDARSWNAFFAPRGTPPAALARLTAALQNAVADPALRKKMEGLGVELPQPADATPANVSQLIARGLRVDVPALKAKGEYLD